MHVEDGQEGAQCDHTMCIGQEGSVAQSNRLHQTTTVLLRCAALFVIRAYLRRSHIAVWIILRIMLDMMDLCDFSAKLVYLLLLVRY